MTEELPKEENNMKKRERRGKAYQSNRSIQTKKDNLKRQTNR